MADAGEGLDRGARPAPRHLIGGGGGQQHAVGAAQDQGRTADLVPKRPEIEILARQVLIGHPDCRVIVQPPARLISARAVLRQMLPLRVAERPEGRMDLAQMPLQLGQVREHQIQAEIELDLRQRQLRHERADVVQDQPAQRRPLSGGQRHADQAAHRGADPVDRRQSQQLAKARQVAGIGRDRVVFWIVEPAAAAASDHVDREHPRALGGQRARQMIEVAGVAGQAVDAEHDLLGARLAPFDVGQLDRGMRPIQSLCREAHPHSRSPRG